MKRIEYIDWIKGFGIILVILNHILESGHQAVAWMGTFHMPLFFIISGMLLVVNDKWEKKSIKENVNHKFKKLILPYLKMMIVLIIFLAIIGLIFKETNYYKNIIDIIKQTIFLEGYGPMWFVFALFFGEIIFIILKKINVHEIAIFSICVIITGSYFFVDDLRIIGDNILIRYLYTLLFVFVRSCLACSFISLGYIFEKYIHKFIDTKIAICLLAVHFLMYGANGYIIVSNLNLNNVFLFYGIATIGAVSWITIIERINWQYLKQFLAFYGKNSYIILCTHESFMIVTALKIFISQPLIILICVMIIEYFIILIVNKYFYKFLFAK